MEWGTVTCTMVLALALAAARGAAEPVIVVVPDGPRDEFDCDNDDLYRKRYRTREACLLDLCGGEFSADLSSLYVSHPRTHLLVRNPCFMLDRSPR